MHEMELGNAWHGISEWKINGILIVNQICGLFKLDGVAI